MKSASFFFGSGIGNRGEPRGEALLLRRQKSASRGRFVRGGNGALHLVDGVVEKKARGTAARKDDRPAVNAGRGVYARGGEGGRIGHGGVSVDADRQDRGLRESPVQKLVAGELPRRPCILVPTAALDPGLATFRGMRDESRHRFLPGLGAEKLGALKDVAVAQEMAVRIHEAGVDDGISEIEPPSRREGFFDIVAPSDGDDAAAVDGHALGD